MTAQQKTAGLKSLRFDNRFTRELPADPITENYTRQVAGACFSRVEPTKVAQPKLVAYAKEVAELLDLSEPSCQSEEFVNVFAGNQLLPEMDPFALCYGGHQFGNWAGQLGDGRAINLGEVVNHNGQRHTLQLKGSGLTPYSRTADGLAVLRSSVREFLCSEAMHHLGVPTTRALSLVLTGEQVVRDMFYDGNPKKEPGAIVCRVAPSFTRFGSFQIFASRGDTDHLKQLADYTIRTDFPHLGEPSKQVYIDWFKEICRTTAEMVVHWMRVGFVHGVMNTDNMSILGLTIDYGPYGWLEDFDPHWTPNTTDAHGKRYRFGNQPQVAQWNLYQLANAIYPLIDEAEPLEQALASYAVTYQQLAKQMMAAKLGLKQYNVETDDPLCNELEEILQLVETDMTIFYRQLGRVVLDRDISPELRAAPLQHAFYEPDQLTDEYHDRLNQWLDNYQSRIQSDGTTDSERRTQMDRVNPKYVLRNYIAQLAIDKSEQGDYSLVNELLEVLRHPYDEQPKKEHFAEKRPDWARSRAGCSMLSCSS